MNGAMRFAIPGGILYPGRVRLGSRMARHMQVMRLRPGARVVLFDDTGSEYEAQLVSLARDDVEVEVGLARPGPHESPLAVHLIQAIPVKLSRFDTVVRMCTELGVASIRPLRSARGQVPAGGTEVVARRCRRWRRIARTAAQQCGRSAVPRVHEPCIPERLEWEKMAAPILMLEPDAAVALGPEVLGDSVTAVSLLVGPEGGWSDEELELFRGNGVAAVSVGPRILRSDSAGAVAIALLQGLRGDLR